ncbi:MAG: diguanylate cyclase (GGDEF)-like protein/PAS domain S-box-containing protein [Gammaproteobacteria bacterium]|jgi:diguanylate cyclase (GGDEF)-like protein/PAS domain S-box-containing protein
MSLESEKLIRLLIVDEGLHKAEQITSSLRAAGLHVRAEFAEDSEDMCELLEHKALDLVIFSMELPGFDLRQAQHLIRECGRHVAIIATTKEYNADLLVDALSQGVQDVIMSGNLEHLTLALKREAHNLFMWRKAMRLELEFQESEKRCQGLLANSRDAVAYVHEGMHIYANQAYMELFGNTDFDELEGTPIMDMVDISQQNQLKTFLRESSMNKVENNSLDLKLIHSSGELLDTTLEFSRASYDGEPCTQIVIRSMEDTTELEEQINYLHQHDVMSGLYNRQFFMDELKTMVAQSINGMHQAAVTYIAIDNFQAIRDMVGISGCDILIADIAKIISETASEDHVVARFGANSYTCIGKITEKYKIEAIAAKIPELVEQHISEIGNQSISATASAAVVFIDENSPDNANEIISRAERTCEGIQLTGGGKSKTYIPKAGEMTQEEEDGVVATAVKDALNNNRIKGLYQPIISITAAGGEGYISYLEVSHADGNIIQENDYQPAAERTGTAKMLDRWKILHAIKKIIETSQQNRKVNFFIPLSSDSLQDSGLAMWISDNLTKAGITGEHLVFMVNAIHIVNQLKAAKTLFKTLKQLHCQFAIDEFGTGLKPFQLIKHIQADYIRVNPVFMDNLPASNENQDSIREISDQARSMEISSITSGVADAAVLSVLWSLGIDFVHGDFLQKPDRLLNYDFSSMSG